MKYAFSARSEARLATCHKDIQRVVRRAMSYQIMDFSVGQGYRGETEQTAAFQAGSSKLKFPDSKHNKAPSEAVDLWPYPLDWKDEVAFAKLAGIILAAAAELDVELAWGYDLWRWDMPHFQIEI